MIIKHISIEKFRSFENVEFDLGKRLTAISGRNATQKTTLLGMIGQPFTISANNPMYGCKTIDGYNFRSQFREKFKISPEHDTVGEHKWTLNFHQGIYEKDYYSVESIARKQSGKDPTLRFWNAESRKSGAGYVQLPVYFLSLSRLFPIGETGKTNPLSVALSDEELEYCIDNYRTILSIQGNESSYQVGVEKGAASRTFAGVSDAVHDIFTNSAGEGNVVRIILAILSFRRLKNQYNKDYKGGILLIDELDATLYGFSQEKLVEYLWKAADDYKVQIIFTTHSPIILKRLSRFQRDDRQRMGIDIPNSSYSTSIVYLEPVYDSNGKRLIRPENISTTEGLNRILSDINLMTAPNCGKVRIYCEDLRAVSFIKYVLTERLDINLDIYMEFMDVNLGWTNYIQLASKDIPEFQNNMIVLDADVLEKNDYKKDAKRRKIVSDNGNFLFLPLTIEKDIFVLLKDYAAFSRFESSYSKTPPVKYDILFKNWPLASTKYDTQDFKKWFEETVTNVCSAESLFEFWCSENQMDIDAFISEFCTMFNRLAEKNDMEALPPVEITYEEDN